VGEGRILIAASNVNEPAWETAGSGHGLLTMALIDTLGAADGAVDIQSAISQVMSIVRTEAERIGVTQTPVMVGRVTGGLVMPALPARGCCRRPSGQRCRGTLRGRRGPGLTPGYSR
jgi:helicase